MQESLVARLRHKLHGLTSNGHALPYGVLALGMFVHVAAKLPIITGDHGIYWPDEIYESYEMAHKAVFGYGVIPWEFVEGARNWAFPLLMSIPMKLSVMFVSETPETYIFFTRCCFLVLSLFTGWYIYTSSLKFNRSPLAAALAAAAFLSSGTTLYFSHRALSEVAAQLPTLVGVTLLSQAPRTRRDILLGGALLGVATLLRLQLGLVCLTIVLIELIRLVRDKRRLPEFALLLATLTVFALAYGALDAWFYRQHPNARYHGWFHSAFVYFNFSLSGKPAIWGTSPFYYYGETLLRAWQGLALVLALGILLALKRLPWVVLVVAVFIGAHSLVPHKELRFILPVMPLIFVVAAVGLSSISHAEIRFFCTTALFVTSFYSLLGHRSLTMGDLGAYPDRPTDPAFDDFGSVNRLLLKLNKRDDVCGVRVGVHLAWAGGQTYLHRKVPMYYPSKGRPENFNYAILPRNAQTSGMTVAEDGYFNLVRFPGSPCQPDPDYDWMLH